MLFLLKQNKKLKLKLSNLNSSKNQNLDKYIKLSSSLKQVTHQWRQPLNAISLGIQELQIIYQLNSKLSDDDIKRFVNESNKQIKNMSQAIDNIKKCFNEQIDFKTYSAKDLITNAANHFENKKISIHGNDFCIELDANFSNIIAGLISAIKDENIDFYLDGNIKLQANTKLSEAEQNIIFKPSLQAFKEQRLGFEPYIGKIIVEQLYNLDLKAYNNEVGFVFEIDFNLR